jgi:hypothetical protein
MVILWRLSWRTTCCILLLRWGWLYKKIRANLPSMMVSIHFPRRRFCFFPSFSSSYNIENNLKFYPYYYYYYYYYFSCCCGWCYDCYYYQSGLVEESGSLYHGFCVIYIYIVLDSSPTGQAKKCLFSSNVCMNYVRVPSIKTCLHI